MARIENDWIHGAMITLNCFRGLLNISNIHRLLSPNHKTWDTFSGWTPYSSSLALLELSFGLKIWIEFTSKGFFSLHSRNLLSQPRHLLVVVGPLSNNPPGCWQLRLLVLQNGAVNMKDFRLKLIGDMHLREGIVAKVNRLGILQTLLAAPCFAPKPLLWQAFNWDLK